MIVALGSNVWPASCASSSVRSRAATCYIRRQRLVEQLANVRGLGAAAAESEDVVHPASGLAVVRVVAGVLADFVGQLLHVLRHITRLHPVAYRLLRWAGVLGRQFGMRNVILTTTGH